MFCSECGQKNDDEAKFCMKCGKKLVTHVSNNFPQDSESVSNQQYPESEQSFPSGSPEIYEKMDLKESSGVVTVLSVIGFVFGILGMLGSFIPCLGAIAFYIGIPAAFVSFLALIIAHQINVKKTFAIVALTISSIGVIISFTQYHSIIQWARPSYNEPNLQQNTHQDLDKDSNSGQDEPYSFKVIDPKKDKSN